MTRLASLLVLFSALLTAPAVAQITYAEPPDLANDVASATPFTLAPGANSVSGTVTTPSDRQDNFTITIPTGAMLTGATLTLDTSRGFVGSVTFNLMEVRTSSGAFTMGFPFGPGTYYVQVITDFSVGNTWSMAFTVSGGALPVCGDGTIEGAETCDDGNMISCDGCSALCAADTDGCNILGTCVAEGSAAPGNPCRTCQRAVSRTDYSPVAAGTACDDTLFCTSGDVCDGAGTCAGPDFACNDGDECTLDTCDEDAAGCEYDLNPMCIDAGPRDAGPTPVTDAGPTPGTDAGPTPATDAGPTPGTDAGPSAFPDAGSMTDPDPDDDGGCSCRVADRSSASTAVILAGVALALTLRRRKR